MNTLLECYKEGLFQKKYWLQNILAGIIVGIVALPLAMAFAIASGAKPEQGLYTAIVAGFLVSTMGGSRLQIAGPTGAFIVILSGITAKYGIDGLQIATMIAGVMLLLFGVARLGTIIKFIPNPVIVGFTTGIAVVIWVGQWQPFFGLPQVTGAHFHEKLWALIQVFPQFDMHDTLLGSFSLLLLLVCPRVPGLNRIPAPMIALVVATMVQSYFQFSDVATIGSLYGGIPKGLPSFAMPDITVDRVLELIGPAFTIALLGAIESLLSAVVADGMSSTQHNSNRELVGQGLANIFAPMFGGFAATGAIARTATNIRNGGTTPIAGIVHCLTLVLIIVFLAPLAVNIPLTALAAILFVVCWNMSEAHHFFRLIQVAPRADVAVLLVTFFLTVFVDLIIAVNIGVIIAILHFLASMSNSVQIQRMTDEELGQELKKNNLPELPRDLLVYIIDGPFFFGAVENFQLALAATHTDPKVLIFRMRWVPFVDMTALKTLEEVVEDLQRRKVRVLIAGANPSVTEKLRAIGIVDKIGEQNFHKDFVSALVVAREHC